jgi:uncharacterized spore protein YtfJ
VTDVDRAAALLSRIGDSISGHKSFGPSFEKDGVLVIPVAYVFGGGGGGEGEEPAKAGEGEGPKKGIGGGYGLVSWPIGAYVVQNGQVRWVPVIDPAVMLTTGGLALATVIRALRRKKSSRRQRRHER